MDSLAPILPKFTDMAFKYMAANMELYQAIISEGPSGRHKTIGVDYSRQRASKHSVSSLTHDTLDMEGRAMEE